MNLTVTGFTTSSVSLSWTKPEGISSFYRVQRTNGSVTETVNVTTGTSTTITNLTAGVQYNITVTAVAGDGSTYGQSTTVSQYTMPDVVMNLTVTGFTTSSVSLSWTKPEGISSFYRVQWTNGSVTETVNVTTGTSTTITNLTAGVQYNITVTAVAGDGSTYGQSTTVSQYTKPGKIALLTVATNTSSIALTWTPPPGQVAKYMVRWLNGGVSMVIYTNNTTAVLSNLIPGTSYVITVTAIAGGNQTGESYTFTSVTKPAVVRSLTIINITTSSVSLDWTEPVGNVTSYTVQWIGGGVTLNDTTSESSFTVNNLIPGFQYNITVAAVSVNSSNTGDSTLISTFTIPEKPGNITITARGTNNLSISWTLPRGRVDNYVVNISNGGLIPLYSNITAMTSASFTGLNPGRIFIITVTSVAGNFRATSDQSSFATYPTPPGSIIISQRTNSSLYIKWATPALMEGAPNISYNITYQNGGVSQDADTKVNQTELSLLSSGTSYNITVETVGPQNLRSTVVPYSATTLPNPVLNLVARPKSTTSVEVTWSYPYDFKSYYTYLVQTYNSMGALINNTTVSNNITDVPNLEPGTRYNFTVTTIAATGSGSTVEQTFSYTMPKAVTNLTVQVVNTTSIQLTWLRQSDYKPTYSYLVLALKDTMKFQNTSALTETCTFFNLTPGALYTFNVFTVVGGVTSEVDNTSSYTKPDVVSGIVAIGSTSNMSVSWNNASGQVASYDVLLYKNNSLERNYTNLSNTTVNKLFQGLKPGVLYCVAVVTNSGPYRNSSRVCNATFPNPPGPIMVASQTVESINFTWPFPEDMDYNQYNFTVSSFMGLFSTKNNWFLLAKLKSGSYYNISVVTVGVWNYESTEVIAENYTRPYPVTMLTQAGITTNAVTLMWEQQESKSYYSYVVQVSNSSFSSSKAVLNTSITITGLLSGSNYSFTVTTQTADGTQAAPVTVWYFTRPYSTSWSKVETLNSTAIHLVWMKPLDYKNGYTYTVTTTGCASKNITVAEEDTLISELTPGTNCTFCVYVRAVDGTEGQANCTSQYTQPGTVQPRISSQGSNSSILVSWTKPPGKVEYYNVYLNGTSTALVLNSISTSWLFRNLAAGILYSVVVTTFSGPFNASSASITNATFPNAPGPVEVLTKTTSSITIRWRDAPLMTGASFFYQLTYTTQQGRENISTTTTTNYTFAPLPSGTSYNIYVATVGVMGFESGKVQIPMVTTRPFSVRSVNATTEEKNIIVMWKEPDEYKESYRYNLTWQSSDGSINSNITNITEYNIRDLIPGSPYIINVITQTSDGTQSAPNSTSCCTDASPVETVQCTGPNTTNAELILSWNWPKGQYSDFRVTAIKDGKIINTLSSSCCNQTFSNLRHHTEYNLTVETQSCGSSSTPFSYLCSTGITIPPIPDNFESLVRVSEKVYNKFSLKIDSSLLNNTSGPITHVGVLMTSNLSDDTSDFTKYLGNTYYEWKAGSTPRYLATVKKTIQTRSEENPLSIQVGDGSQWEGYINGALDASRKYQYAIVLFTSLTVQNTLVNGSLSLVSVTNFYPVIELPMNPAIGIAIGATLGFVCVLIVLIGFIIYWKRFSTKETTDIQIQSMRAKVSVAVRVEDYEAYYKKQKADSNCGFAEEFEDLKPVGTVQSKASALTVENKPKNRYNNVLPYDSSRVKLSIIHGSPYDDYINANYMPGYNSKKEFIAAQGPLPTTVNEFWRMIWEKNVRTVVMLTRCNEQGRVKCEQYWASGTKHFDSITVTTTSEIPLDDWTIRDFSVKNVKTAETRSVRHFHFTAWPDHGVPETTELLISFRHLVREHMDQYSRHSPTVVHCSAGVGRTGTFIAIDRLIFQIERENIVDVFGIVHDLRMHRPLMVQTEDQYVFLNQCSMDIIRSRTGTNVDLIYQNTAALSIYENVAPKKGFPKNGYHNA